MTSMASNTGLNFSLFEHRRLSFENSQVGVNKDVLSNNGFHCDSPSTAKCHFCGYVVNLLEYEGIDEKDLHLDYCQHLHGSERSQNEPQDETRSTNDTDRRARGRQSEECLRELRTIGNIDTGLKLREEMSLRIEEELEVQSFHLGLKDTIHVPNTTGKTIIRLTNRRPSMISIESKPAVTDVCSTYINSKVKPNVTIEVASEVKIIVSGEPVTICPSYGRNNAIEVTVGSTSKMKIRVDREVSPDDETGNRITDEVAVKLDDKGQRSQDKHQDKDKVSGHLETPEVPTYIRILSSPESNVDVIHSATRRPIITGPSVVSGMVDNGRAVQDLETSEVYLCGNIHSWQPDCHEERTTQGQNAVHVVNLIPVENQTGVPPSDPYGTTLLAL